MRLMPKILLLVLNLRFYDVFFIRTKPSGVIQKNEKNESQLFPLYILFYSSHIDLVRVSVAQNETKWNERSLEPFIPLPFFHSKKLRKGCVAKMESHVIHTYIQRHTNTCHS